MCRAGRTRRGRPAHDAGLCAGQWRRRAPGPPHCAPHRRAPHLAPPDTCASGAPGFARCGCRPQPAGGGTEPVVGKQVDFFDPGLAGADAAEAALVRLLDDQGPVVVAPHISRHPLVERRTRWMVREPGDPASSSPGISDPCLSLHLLPEPLQVRVETCPRRDHCIPVRYCEGGRRGCNWLPSQGRNGHLRRPVGG